VTARRCLGRASAMRDIPEKIAIDMGGVNTAAIESVRAVAGLEIELRQIKYLNNIVGQAHRANKRIV